MTIKDVVEGLSDSEKSVLRFVKKGTALPSIISGTGLSEIVVMRSLQWLSNKGLVSLSRVESEVFVLGSNGEVYVRNGLPEQKFLEYLSGKKTVSLSELSKIISGEEINACIGILKKKGFIIIDKKDELFFSITKEGERFLKKGSEGLSFLKSFPRKADSFSDEEKIFLREFLNRKDILVKEKRAVWLASITSLGEKVVSSKELGSKHYERVTPDLIKKKQVVSFKRYDVKSVVPSIGVGRKHLVSEAKKYIKSIWLELGFEEMSGGQVQPAFWNLDALFVPQDHPAREMQDTFYVEGSARVDDKIFDKVKKVHVNGGDTGSSGWGGSFSRSASEELMLRTHTTVLSALKFAELKREDLPKKFFVVDKNFRNEALDWKHLFEFHQVEGIVVDPEGDLPKLKGYLKEFFEKMGFSDVRIRPAHFPYTEPSAEVEAFNPSKKQWVEMGGAGIIRPEVSKTLLGFECPVLAWGLGMERVISKYYEISDIRDIYRNDLEYLKNVKVFIK